MLEAVNNKYKTHILNNNIKTNSYNKNNFENKQNAVFQTSPFYTPSASQYISFLGNINQSDDFQKTVEFNYFKLPKVELENGEIHQIKPDIEQIECAKKLYDGDTTIFEASTGAGKTALAHYAVNKNLFDGKQTIITVPLISLANDKYREFSQIYGKDSVGLFTGVNKINTEAPIKIMVTEILRNQADSIAKNQDEIGTIVFDEAHFIGDEHRGAVWENSIINALKNDIQVLCLSATLGNGDDFSSWIKSLNPEKNVSKVELSVNSRFVPLSYSVYNPDDARKKGTAFTDVVSGKIDLKSIDENNLSARQKRALDEIYRTQNKKSNFYELNDNEYATTLKNLKIKTGGNSALTTKDFQQKLAKNYPELDKHQRQKISLLLLEESKIKKAPIQNFEHDDYPRLVEDMRNEDLLPALIFKLSQKGCDSINASLLENGTDLTTADEKNEIRKIIAEHKAQGAYFGPDFDETSLIYGYGSHHAGKLPSELKLVEDLFSKKLIKVVSATSTLSAGINMPVRSVVMSDVTYKKFNPITSELDEIALTPSEFHQMVGRAGRRGIDASGNVILYNIPSNTSGVEANPLVDKESLAYELIESKPNNLRSNFHPEPIMMAQYYYENSTNDNLWSVINDTFKVHIAKNPDKEAGSLMKKFENYSQVLLKQGFLMRNYKNEFELTPKGLMLKNSQGANPLMLSSLVYDEKLAGLSPVGLAQIAGYIASSDNQDEDKNTNTVYMTRLKYLVQNEPEPEEIEKEFAFNRDLYQGKEKRVARSLVESNVKLENIELSNNFGGFINYLWAYSNEKNLDSIANFDNLLINSLKPMGMNNEKTKKGKYIDDPQKDAKRDFNRQATKGRAFKIISQSISVLKQIQSLCDDALADEYNYPNSDYYKNLKQTAQQAMDLVYRPPIFEDFDKE